MKKKPVIICPVCEKRFTSASVVLIVDKKTIIHSNFKCWSVWFTEQQKNIPKENKQRLGKYDSEFRFTQEYDKSNKVITEDKYNEYKKMFNRVNLLTDSSAVKLILRGIIWKAVGRKYTQQLQLIHALNRIHDKKKDSWRSNFHKTFIPSVLNQFRKKGYLSKKQWELINELVYQELDPKDKNYFYQEQARSLDIENLTLPDRLRYMQRKKSFIKWYNQKNNISEENEKINEETTETLE